MMLITLLGCDKDNNSVNRVPFVEVNFALNLDDPELIKLRTIGNWEYITGGSKGILVYRVSNTEFVAFDRNCTFDVTAICSQLDVDATGFKLNDYDCCGSEFSISTGSVLKGPANVPLRQYVTNFDGRILTITN